MSPATIVPFQPPKRRLAREPFAQIPINILRHHGLSPWARVVFAELASHGDDIHPGLDRMACHLGTSTRTVKRALRELATVGAITIERRGSTSNRYLLHADLATRSASMGHLDPVCGDTGVPSEGPRVAHDLDQVNQIKRTRSHMIESNSDSIARDSSIPEGDRTEGESSAPSQPQDLKPTRQHGPVNQRGAQDERSSAAMARPAPGGGFDAFWAAYPRKVAKQAAFSEWRRLTPGRAEVDQMMAALRRQKASERWSNPRFIPHPATWLRDRRWEDQLELTRRQNDRPPAHGCRHEPRCPDEFVHTQRRLQDLRGEPLHAAC